MTAECEAINLAPHGGRWVCALKPAAPYRRGCPHEHIHEGPLCAFHTDSATEPLCIECLDHQTDPHLCRMHLQPVAGVA